MTDKSLTPVITVAIGHHTRSYFAFVTTAPVALDAPATVTLHAASFSDVAGLAAHPVEFDNRHSTLPARLILVDSAELTEQRARCREGQHRLLPADPILVGLNKLQHWLWRRLQNPIAVRIGA